MLTAREIRERVLQGLASGKLWRLTQDTAKSRDGGPGQCYVCWLTIPRGQAYEISGATFPVRLHLECYLVWLHVSGVYQPEPITCAACRRVIPPHAEVARVDDQPYHGRCWERAGMAGGGGVPSSSQGRA